MLRGLKELLDLLGQQDFQDRMEIQAVLGPWDRWDLLDRGVKLDWSDCWVRRV